MNLSQRLSTFFNVEPGEGRLVSLLFTQYFLLGAAFNFVQTAAFTLFLVEFNAQTLPYVYLANAVIISLLTFLYLRLGRRSSFSRLLAINLSFLLVLVVAFRLGLALKRVDLRTVLVQDRDRPTQVRFGRAHAIPIRWRVTGSVTCSGGSSSTPITWIRRRRRPCLLPRSDKTSSTAWSGSRAATSFENRWVVRPIGSRPVTRNGFMRSATGARRKSLVPRSARIMSSLTPAFLAQPTFKARVQILSTLSSLDKIDTRRYAMRYVSATDAKQRLAALLAATRQGRRFRLLCSEGRPQMEGRTLARTLAAHRVPVDLLTDAGLLAAISEHARSPVT